MFDSALGVFQLMIKVITTPRLYVDLFFPLP